MEYGITDLRWGYTMKCIHLKRALSQYHHLMQTWPETTVLVKREASGQPWQEACAELEENGTCIHSDHMMEAGK